jgi:hypothetical protein
MLSPFVASQSGPTHDPLETYRRCAAIQDAGADFTHQLTVGGLS